MSNPRLSFSLGETTAIAAIARHREIQFAADATCPASNKANASIRTEFGLPANKALK